MSLQLHWNSEIVGSGELRYQVQSACWFSQIILKFLSGIQVTWLSRGISRSTAPISKSLKPRLVNRILNCQKTQHLLKLNFGPISSGSPHRGSDFQWISTIRISIIFRPVDCVYSIWETFGGPDLWWKHVYDSFWCSRSTQTLIGTHTNRYLETSFLTFRTDSDQIWSHFSKMTFRGCISTSRRFWCFLGLFWVIQNIFQEQYHPQARFRASNEWFGLEPWASSPEPITKAPTMFLNRFFSLVHWH